MYTMKSRWDVRWAGHVVREGKIKFVYRILVGKPERKKRFRIRKHILEDIIKLDLK